ncbi:MAG TPA: QueT transporter family protein [Tissierellaceae bacterium]
MDIKKITRAGLIAGIYIILVFIQLLPGVTSGLVFGPVQLRIAEGLTILPFFDTAAIPGLFIGCLLSNLIIAPYAGFGYIDIIGGSLVTLLAAYFSSKMKNKYLAMLPPIVLNAVIVSLWVSYFSNIPYLMVVLGIGLGQTISVLLFGSIVSKVYEKVLIDKEYNNIK